MHASGGRSEGRLAGEMDGWWTHEEGLSLGDWETGQVINKQIWTGDE